MGDFVLVEQRADGIAFVTLNRPDVLNALNTETLLQLRTTLEDLSGRASVRCLLLQGAGSKAFCAGADINELSRQTIEARKEFMGLGHEVLGKLETFPAPTLALIGGHALGGGLELALCCDVRIAGEGATLGMPETSLGFVPGFGGVTRLARLLGHAKTAELIFGGVRLTAQEALAIGLVNQVVPTADLLPTGLSLAGRFAGNAPTANRLAKQILRRGEGLDRASALELDRSLSLVSSEHSNKAEGLAAWKEKRRPVFKDE